MELDGPSATAIDIRHELLEPTALRVMVHPGTLPSAAARSLREIATLIEHDKRLLSARFWIRETNELR